MILNEVTQCGAVVSIQTDNWYTLTMWHRLKGGGRIHETVYSDLSWSELLDVLLAELHGRRPGWALGDGWSQPPLPLS